TGQPLGQFAMSLFGESVVFVVYPQESGKPAGVLLLRAVNERALQKALATWNIERRVKLEKQFLAKAEYIKRTESKPHLPGKEQIQYYFVQGPVFALSDDETLIQSIVRRSSGENPQPTLVDSDRYQTARRSLAEDCFATLYFNPQAWNPGWELEEGKSRVEKWIASLWKRSYAIGAGLRADRGMALDVVVHYDPANLPERWRQLVERTSGFPRFLNQVPAGAFLVLAGKQDLAGVDRLITAEMDEKSRQQWEYAMQVSRGLLLGLDLFEDVLPTFGPNWGLCVFPRQALDPNAVPAEGLVAFELPPASDEQNPITVRKALKNALNTGFNLVAAVQNSKPQAKPVILKSEQHTGGPVHWIDTIGPYRPAYCLSGEYLIFASSPRLIAEFLSPTQSKLVDSSVFFPLWTNRHKTPEGQLLFLNWLSIRQFLKSHHAVLLDQAVKSHALPREEAEKRLTRLQEILEVLDGAYLGLQIQEDRIHLTLGGITRADEP
ncbi:MAG: DUF3352 domain-containing protein, partial [Planctomycetaceae bacterium]|nr:DUF3352 domain-containing protein [Planctomycetaceae bacterium]